MLFGDAKDGGMDVDTVVTIKMATDVPPPSSHHLPEDLLRCTHTQSHKYTHKHTHTHNHTHTRTHTHTHTHTITKTQKHRHTHTHRKTSHTVAQILTHCMSSNNKLNSWQRTSRTFHHYSLPCGTHTWITFFTALTHFHFVNRLNFEKVRLSILNG